MRQRAKLISTIITFAQACVLAVIVAVLPGGAGVQAAVPIHITGAVTSQTGDGIANVSVTATDPGNSTVEAGPVTTAADGTYSLDIATAGTYDFHFDPPSGSGVNPIVDSNVTIIGDQTINIQLAPTPPPTHNFSGTLVDNNGNPIPGISITIGTTADFVGGTKASGSTDANGHFSIDATPTVYAFISLSRDSSNTLSLGGFPVAGSISLTNGFSTALANLDLTNSDVSQTLTLNLVKLTVLTEDVNGNPESGVNVNYFGNSGLVAVSAGNTDYLLDRNRVSPSGPIAVTGADGTYTVLVPQGTIYSVNVTFPDGATANTSSNVTASGDVTVELTHPAPPPVHTFSGTLVDNNGNPIPKASIEIGTTQNFSGGLKATGITDTNGNFSITATPALYPYIEITQTSNNNPIILGGYPLATSIDLRNGFSNSPLLNIDLTNSDITQTVALNLVKLTVLAKDVNGNPVSGVRVSYTGSGGSTALNVGGTDYVLDHNSVSRTGPFVFTGTDGTFTVLVPQGVNYSASGTFADGTTGSSSTVTASGDTTLTVTQPAPPVTHNFSGTLVDNSGNPIPNTSIVIGINAGLTGATKASGGTDANGHFSINAPPAVYTHISLTRSTSSILLLGGYPLAGSISLTNGFSASLLPNLDLTNSDVSQTLTLNLVKLTIVAKDANGNPESGVKVSYTGTNGLVTINAGSANYPLDRNSVSRVATSLTGADGTFTVLVPQGVNYGASVTFADGTVANTTSNVTASGDVTILFQQNNPIIETPAAPTNLTAPSPAQHPSLTWDTVSGAASYNIYRNGTKIDTSTTASYTDNTARAGTSAYYVTAVNVVGESGPSNSVDVTVITDATPPTITYTVSPAPNANGWNNSAVTVTFNCSDSESGVQFCSPAQTESSEGTFTLTGTAIDNAGNTATVDATVNVDLTAPAITYALSPDPNSAGWNNSDVTVNFSCEDMLSGVATCSAPVTLSSNGANQTVTGTATDFAGNTSTVTATINIDKSVPMVETPSWSENPIVAGNSTTLSAVVNQAASPVVAGEYYIGGTDPGQGNGNAMTYDGATATISATFGASLTPGSYQVHVRAKDAAGLWGPTVTTTLVVKPVPVAPTITSANNYTIGVRQIITPADFTFTTTGTPAPNLSESGALPAGLSFTDNGDGTANFTGMVAAGTAGTYHITVTATNSAGSVSQNFTLTITDTDSAPTTIFTNTGSDTLHATVGTPVTFTFTATGNGKNSKIFLFSGTMPPGLNNLHDNKDGTASFSGTPTTAGTYTFTLEAQNKEGMTFQQFTVIVS